MNRSKFHHEEIYRGKNLLEQLNKQFITICGIGALGSNLADTLIRQGFANLRVIDKDRVESHNINTQIYGDADVGALKVDALKNSIFKSIGVEVESQNKELKESNVKKLLKDSTLVVDCFDNSNSRKLVQDECRRANIQCIHAGLYEDYGQVTWDEVYRVPKDVEGDVCDYPLARNLISIVVAIAAEEIVNFSLAQIPRKKNWSLTLKDLTIRSF